MLARRNRQYILSVFLPDLGICMTRIVPRRVCLLLCVLRASSPNCVAVVSLGRSPVEAGVVDAQASNTLYTRQQLWGD